MQDKDSKMAIIKEIQGLMDQLMMDQIKGKGGIPTEGETTAVIEIDSEGLNGDPAAPKPESNGNVCPHCNKSY